MRIIEHESRRATPPDLEFRFRHLCGRYGPKQRARVSHIFGDAVVNGRRYAIPLMLFLHRSINDRDNAIDRSAQVAMSDGIVVDFRRCLVREDAIYDQGLIAAGKMSSQEEWALAFREDFDHGLRFKQGGYRCFAGSDVKLAIAS